MITKSGGNTFSGSFRSNFSNSAWTKETPREKAAGTDRPDKLNQTYEATFGGPILRDRLWFFTRRPLAGPQHVGDARRDQPAVHVDRSRTSASSSRAPARSPAGHTRSGELHPRHRRRDAAAVRLLDRSERRRASELPEPAVRRELQRRADARSCSPTFQVSQKKEGFRGSGGFDTDIHASPFFTQGVADGVPGGLHYNGNYFDATDPEDRDNRQYRRQPVVLPDHAARRLARRQGRHRALQVEPDRRQLAERDRLRVRHRLPAGRQRAGARRAAAGSSRRSRRASRSSRTGSPRAAPTSTSARCRSTCRTTGRSVRA